MAPSFKSKMPLQRAEELAEKLKRILINEMGARRVQVCGSIRRRKPEVGDIDAVVDMDMLKLRVNQDRVWWEYVDGGESKATISLEGVQVNLLRSDDEHWGAAIFYFTGPHDYNIAYRARAKKMGLLLNEKGLFNAAGVCLACKLESDIYAQLGKQYKAPEQRGTR